MWPEQVEQVLHKALIMGIDVWGYFTVHYNPSRTTPFLQYFLKINLSRIPDKNVTGVCYIETM